MYKVVVMSKMTGIGQMMGHRMLGVVLGQR